MNDWIMVTLYPPGDGSEQYLRVQYDRAQVFESPEPRSAPQQGPERTGG